MEYTVEWNQTIQDSFGIEIAKAVYTAECVTLFAKAFAAAENPAALVRSWVDAAMCGDLEAQAVEDWAYVCKTSIPVLRDMFVFAREEILREGEEARKAAMAQEPETPAPAFEDDEDDEDELLGSSTLRKLCGTKLVFGNED